MLYQICYKFLFTAFCFELLLIYILSRIQGTLFPWKILPKIFMSLNTLNVVTAPTSKFPLKISIVSYNVEISVMMCYIMIQP